MNILVELNYLLIEINLLLTLIIQRHNELFGNEVCLSEIYFKTTSSLEGQSELSAFMDTSLKRNSAKLLSEASQQFDLKFESSPHAPLCNVVSVFCLLYSFN